MEPRIWNIKWNDGMSVGIPEIDADHKRFIAPTNQTLLPGILAIHGEGDADAMKGDFGFLTLARDHLGGLRLQPFCVGP